MCNTLFITAYNNGATVAPANVSRYVYGINSPQITIRCQSAFCVFLKFCVCPDSLSSPLLSSPLPSAHWGHCESSKCLTTEGKLAWRIGSAWRSKSGTKNFAKFLSIHPSCLRLSLPLSLCLPPSLTLLFPPLKFLLGDYPQVSLFPLPACVSSSSPCTDHWAVMGGGGERGEGSCGGRVGWGGGGQWARGEEAVVRQWAAGGRRATGGRGEGRIGVRASPLATNTPWRHHTTEQMTLLPLRGAGEEGRGKGDTKLSPGEGSSTPPSPACHTNTPPPILTEKHTAQPQWPGSQTRWK